MSHRIRIFFLVFIVVLICILIFFIEYSASRVTENPPGTIGNTAGNLNNGGLFCEYNGTVYFSNPYDGGSLYAMDADEGNLRKISSVTVRNLLAGGDYLYYFQTGVSGETGIGSMRSPRSFNRCNLDGRHARSLARDVVISAQLVDNSLYVMATGEETPVFYKMGTDGSDQVVLADYEINPACASNGIIYYNGTRTDHYLYQLNTATDTQSEIWQGNLWYPALYGDYIYYMDVGNNYQLCRYSLSQGVVEVLAEERLDCFNINNGYIYYQTNGNTPQLICMRDDGSGAFVLAEGIYHNINITSGYVYFQEFGNDSTLYHSSLGSAAFDTFTAARDAALAQ